MIEIPGLKIAYIVAGFFGGIVSLRYVKGLNAWQGFLAIITGMGVANYVTPIFQFYLKMPESVEYGAAFIVGFGALNIMGGIFKRFEDWNANPKLPDEEPKQ